MPAALTPHLIQHRLWGYRWHFLLRCDKFGTLGPPQGFQRKNIPTRIRRCRTMGNASGRNHSSLDVSFGFSSLTSSGALLMTAFRNCFNVARSSWDAVTIRAPHSTTICKWGRLQRLMSISRAAPRRQATNNHSLNIKPEFQFKLRLSHSFLLVDPVVVSWVNTASVSI